MATYGLFIRYPDNRPPTHIYLEEVGGKFSQVERLAQAATYTSAEELQAAYQRAQAQGWIDDPSIPAYLRGFTHCPKEQS